MHRAGVFCARDQVGDTETLDDWIVCAKTARAAQIVATIDNIKILFSFEIG